MNFSDITLSGSSAVGIGNSVQLTFTFPEVVQHSSVDMVPEQAIDSDQLKPGLDPTSKPETTEGPQVTLYAIPCIDGRLVKNEGVLFSIFHNKFAQNQEGFTVQVLNDFDIPWVEWKSSKYPMYMRTLNLAKREQDDAEYGQEDENSDVD